MRRLILRLYPAEWRRRYGDELDQLIDDVGLNPSFVLDLTRNGMRERVLSLTDDLNGGPGMTIGPAWRHPTGMAVVAFAVVAPTLLFVLGSVLAYQFGFEAVRQPMDAVNQWLFGRRFVDLLLVMAPAVAVALAAAPLFRLELRASESGREAVFGLRLRAANVVVGLVALAVGAVLVWHIVFESVVELGA